MAAVGSVVKAGIQKVGVGALVGDAFNVIGGVSDYKQARQQGDSKAVSIAKAVGSFAFYEMLGPWAIPLTAVQVGGTLASSYGQHSAKIMTKGGYGSKGKLGSGHFDMTQAGYTMRQRSINAIRSNGLNTQSVLGNEARTYFRGSV